MRITSGRWRGKILKSPKGTETRPTSDRARQAVFNILLHAPWAGPDLLREAVVLDVFAGTGALGLEALSRGAERVVFIEKDREALKALRHNIAACGIERESLVLELSALSVPVRPPSFAPSRLVFCDPPYKTSAEGADLGAAALQALARAGWLAADCLCVMEMAKALPEPPPPGAHVFDERDYGIARMRFLRLAAVP